LRNVRVRSRALSCRAMPRACSASCM
jgi:hypothetical protein